MRIHKLYTPHSRNATTCMYNGVHSDIAWESYGHQTNTAL